MFKIPKGTIDPVCTTKKYGKARGESWRQRATRIDPVSSAKPTGWLCVENRALPITEIDLLEIIPGRSLHIRTRQESWLISLPEELQSDELLLGHYFREGQLLVGLMRSLRTAMRTLQIERGISARR
jgi:hypothetical protein